MSDAMLNHLETDLCSSLGAYVAELVATARARLEGAHVDVAKERAQGLTEMAEERAEVLDEVDVRRTELGLEIAAMHSHKEGQEGRVVPNVCGYKWQYAVQNGAVQSYFGSMDCGDRHGHYLLLFWYLR
jgi:3-dehydroquinate dehydratase